MSVISINGLPGKGKTLLATSLAIKHYKKQNTKIRKLIRKIKKQETIYNSVYSNFPILLDRKKKIYSLKLSIYNIDNKYRFKNKSLLIFDEIQIFYDSDEYKEFPPEIANFNQAHRHFGIQDIIYLSQHPSRIIKKLRNVMSEYYRIKFIFKIPFLKIGFISYRKTYEFEYYQHCFTKDREIKKMYDIKSGIKLINFKRVFNSYNTCYLKPLNSNKDLFPDNNFTNINLDDDYIKFLNNKIF